MAVYKSAGEFISQREDRERKKQKREKTVFRVKNVYACMGAKVCL